MDDLLIALLAAAVRAATPIFLAAAGEIIVERAGVLNLGVEGLMLVGAFAGFAAATVTGSLVLGFVAGAVAGAILAAAHAVASVTFRANQVVSGLALVFVAHGLTDLFGRSYVGRPIGGLTALPLPGLEAVPWLGPVLFRHDAVVYLAFVAAPAAWCLLEHTRIGLHLRAVGESPASADAMGVRVTATRYVATVTGGLFAGLGGAYLSLAYTPLWVSQLTAGRGWIAIALVLLAGWHPMRALAGALLFGGIDALQFRLQAVGTQMPPHVALMLPYVVTLGVLVLSPFARGARGMAAPAALGVPYDRERRG